MYVCTIVLSDSSGSSPRYFDYKKQKRYCFSFIDWSVFYNKSGSFQQQTLSSDYS